MHNSHVEALDLRALRLLATLIETRSVTRAGAAFGLSQPAASRAVARLRRALGDPLLVRTVAGYAPTPRALGLAPDLAAARAAVDRLFAPARFDPATTRQRFRLATTDYGAMTVVPDALARFSRSAPGAALDVEAWSEETLARLEGGALDAALYADAELPGDFHFRALHEEGYSVLFDRRAFGRAPVPAPESLRRIVVLYPMGRQLLEDDPLGDRGAARDAVVLRTPYFAALAAAIRGARFVAALPTRVAAGLAHGAGLALRPLPGEPIGFTYRLIWHRRTHRDSAQAWFRDQIAPSRRPPPGR